MSISPDTHEMTFCGLSHQGQVREENQDRWLADMSLGLFAVADGMGGHAAGGLAAQLVVDLLPKLIHQAMNVYQSGSDDLGELLSEQSAMLSQLVVEETRDRPGVQGLGSTLVAVMVRSRHATIVHLGDSRAYLLRDGLFRQLTVDHTVAQRLVASNELSPEEASHHPSAHRLTQFIGMPRMARPDITRIEFRVGDTLLLCSDGLYRHFEPKQLATIMQSHPDVDTTAQTLIDAANQAGGQDNITALLIAKT